jgi:hypothetical protein
MWTQSQACLPCCDAAAMTALPTRGVHHRRLFTRFQPRVFRLLLRWRARKKPTATSPHRPRNRQWRTKHTVPVASSDSIQSLFGTKAAAWTEPPMKTLHQCAPACLFRAPISSNFRPRRWGSCAMDACILFVRSMHMIASKPLMHGRVHGAEKLMLLHPIIIISIFLLTRYYPHKSCGAIMSCPVQASAQDLHTGRCMYILYAQSLEISLVEIHVFALPLHDVKAHAKAFLFFCDFVPAPGRYRVICGKFPTNVHAHESAMRVSHALFVCFPCFLHQEQFFFSLVFLASMVACTRRAYIQFKRSMYMCVCVCVRMRHYVSPFMIKGLCLLLSFSSVST